MELKQLKRLIAQGEGLKVDFKRDLLPQSMQELAKDIAAFANAEGGNIIVGVDNKRNVVGVDWDEEKSSDVTQEGLNCNPQITIEFEQLDYPGAGRIVVIKIPKSTWIHADANKRFPLRLGDRTIFMDAAGMVTLARAKGMISEQGGSSINALGNNSRRKPKQVAFLSDYLTDRKSFVRLESLTDLSNMTFLIAVEDLPNITETLYQRLSDDEAANRLTTLDVITNLNYRINQKKRKEFLSRLTERLTEMTLSDVDIAVRDRALLTLAGLGSPKVIDVLIKLAATEPQATYAQHNFANLFMRISEAHLGYDLARKVYAELSSTQDATFEARLKVILGQMRNNNWVR